MKRLLIALTIILALSFTSVAGAQENVQVTVGLKTWLATWTASFPVDGGTEEVESDPALLIGPTVGIRYANIFGGITYMFGTFEFPDEDFGGITLETEADRTDLDLVVGYNVHPRVGALIGYKRADITLKVAVDGFEDDIDGTFSGPVVGANFNFPIGESRWIIFGNLSYLFLTLDIEGEEEDAPGFSIELAGAYAFEAAPVSLTAGYKFQRFEGEDSDSIDEFSGLTLGANYTFQ